MLTVIADVWVMRDIQGQRVDTFYPYFNKHAASSKYIERGRAVPVHCCWNGIAVITARPFYQGLKIRTHAEGECHASECSLVCNDLHRLGYRDIIVDPAVRVAYEHEAFAREHEAITKPVYLPYSNVSDSIDAWRTDKSFARSDTYECCSWDDSTGIVDWSRCSLDNVLTVNHTATSLFTHAK